MRHPGQHRLSRRRRRSRTTICGRRRDRRQDHDQFARSERARSAISTRRTSSIDISTDLRDRRRTSRVAHLPRPRSGRVLSDVKVVGPDRVSLNSVRDRVDLLIGKPIDPAQVAKDIARIDSLYQSEGYYLARVKRDTTSSNRADATTLTFHVDEGRRLAISGRRGRRQQGAVGQGRSSARWRRSPRDSSGGERRVRLTTNSPTISAKNIPALYASHGFIDMQVVKDTLIVDRDNGKALVRLDGQRRAALQDRRLRGERRQALLERRHRALLSVRRDRRRARHETVKGVRRPRAAEGRSGRLRRRRVGRRRRARCRRRTRTRATSTRTSARSSSAARSARIRCRRWISAGRSTSDTPAIVNRVDILGNDVTTETCIRDQIFIVPGDVFNRERADPSYQNIAQPRLLRAGHAAAGHASRRTSRATSTSSST